MYDHPSISYTLPLPVKHMVGVDNSIAVITRTSLTGFCVVTFVLFPNWHITAASTTNLGLNKI